VLDRIGSDTSVQAQDEGQVTAQRMARLFRFFRRKAGKESLKCGLWLHPSSVQVRSRT
jgi:hypothetical protein